MEGSQKRPLRLLHTSDLHIGTDIYPKEALEGFEDMLKAALESKIDALLIAGDLFDNGRVPDSLVTRVWDDLGSLPMPVVVVPGNHDLTLTEANRSHATPPNVALLMAAEGECASLTELGLTVWARPVYEHIPEFRPLAGMPKRPDNGWFVAMAHGLFMEELDLYRSSPISPDEIAQAACDYVALGHVHVFRNVSQNGVPAYYSGAPSGSQRRTVALVELDPASGVRVTAVETS